MLELLHRPWHVPAKPVGRSEVDRSPAGDFRPEHPCRHCGYANFTEGRCSRCRRPICEDPGYLDDIEELAGEVVAVAHDEYDDLRGTADSGTDLQQAIVRLANGLRHYHYDGDGCLDD